MIKIIIENCFKIKGKGQICVVNQKDSPDIKKAKIGNKILQNKEIREITAIERSQKLISPGDNFLLIYKGKKLKEEGAYIIK